MKSSSMLTHLVTVLTATMLTICPLASPAADGATDANPEPAAGSGMAVQCPLPPKTAPAVRVGTNGTQAHGGAVSATEEDAFQEAEQSDLTGELLENLVRTDSN